MFKINLYFLLRYFIFCLFAVLIIIDLNSDENIKLSKFNLYLTLFVLIILVKFLKKRLGPLCFVHPGTWFSASWIVAISSYFLLQKWGYVPVENEFLLNRLMFLVIITAIIFFVVLYFTPIINFSNKKQMITTNIMGSQTLLTFFVIVSLLGAIVNWFGIGMPINYTDLVRQQWLQAIPRITAITWYPFHLIFPSAFYAGFKLQDNLLPQSSERSRYFLSVFLLSLTGILWALGTGGRQVTGFVMLYFLLGISFKFAFSIENANLIKYNKKIRYKILLIFTSIVMVFALFASVTNSARAIQQKSLDDKPFEGTPVIGQIGFFVLYMGGTLMTHQAYGLPSRRNIEETGPVSINGLLDWGLSDFTLYNLFNIKRVDASDTNPERALAQYGQELSSGTRNIYYDLEEDFGYGGALIFIGVIVIISQIIFSRIIRNFQDKNLFNFVLIVFLLMYWAYSQQLSLMMHGQLKWTFTSFLLWSICNFILNNNRRYY